MAPIVLSTDIACLPSEVFTLGKQAFVFCGLAAQMRMTSSSLMTSPRTGQVRGSPFRVPPWRLP